MRTVAGLSDDTAISTGLPPTMIAVARPRMIPPESATPVPARVICLSASRRVIDWDMTGILPDRLFMTASTFRMGLRRRLGGDEGNGFTTKNRRER